MIRVRVIAVALVAIGLCQASQAELPHIRLDSIFPLGGQAGSEVTLDIGGKDLDDARGLHFDHAGLKATHVKDRQYRVTIAADVPPGSYEVRAIGKYGISGVQLFEVGRGLTEVAEVEPNDSPDKAQRVPMNAAINGKSDNNGDDFFRFAAKKGGRVVVDCRAFRLNSRLRAIVSVSAADGRVLAGSRPYYYQTDPLLDFTAPADGEYLVRLHEMTFQGGLPYRLVISNHPHIENAFPPAITPSGTAELMLLGRNLPGGQAAPEWVVQDRPLEKLKLPFVVPPSGGWPAPPNGGTTNLEDRFAFINHLASPSLNARGVQLWPPPLKDCLNPVTLAWADLPITTETEPNDSPTTAQQLTLPATVCGRLDRPGDIDWYSFTAKANDAIAVDLLCERLGLPGDPFVIISDAKGQELATIDDHGVNFNGLAQFNRDPVGVFRVPADGTYRLFVQDRYQAGGARYQYVLRLAKNEQDFYPVVVHETPADPTCPVVRQGGSAHYEFCVNRRNLSGPVTVEAEGLPKGVTCPPVHVSPQTQFANVVFTAAADAPDWSGTVRLKAWALIDGKRVERPVRCAQRRWPIANINTSLEVREIALAVRSTAPYGIRLSAETLTVPAGGTLEAIATVARQWPDFKGKVQLNGLNLPPGFAMAATDIGPQQDRATLKIMVAPNVPPGDYSLVMRGDAQVPFAADAKATNRPLVRVADCSTPLTVAVAAAKKK
jgi:Bacterial pre-peptidase C-terminal domain